MSSETLTSVHLQRYEIISSRPFDDVVRAIRAGLGHPDFAALVRKLPTLTDWTGFQAEVAANVGEAGLMVFMELDLGAVVALDPQAHPFKAIRIIAGNPVTMESMVRNARKSGRSCSRWINRSRTPFSGWTTASSSSIRSTSVSSMLRRAR